MEGVFEELFYLAAQRGVVLREVGKGLEREGFYDGAAIVEVVLQSGCGALAFGRGET